MRIYADQSIRGLLERGREVSRRSVTYAIDINLGSFEQDIACCMLHVAQTSHPNSAMAAQKLFLCMLHGPKSEEASSA